MCEFLSHPIKYLEKRKVEKIYKEVVQDDIWDSKIYPYELEI